MLIAVILSDANGYPLQRVLLSLQAVGKSVTQEQVLRLRLRTTMLLDHSG
jgi:hypothetical protein